MPNSGPQVFIQMSVGTTAKLSSGKYPPDYILGVFTGLLWSPEPLCTMAVRALSEIGVDSIPYLLKACASTTLSPSIYDDVATALGRLGRDAKSAVPELLRLLQEGHPRQQSLILALARIAPDDERALQYLSNIIATDGDVMQDVVVAALNKLASYKALEILRQVRTRTPSAEENRLVVRLANGPLAEKTAALEQVEQRLPIGAQFFVDPLIAMIESPSSTDVLKDRAAQVLAKVLPCLPDALTTYLQDLMDPDSRISRAIARGDAFESLLTCFGHLLCSSDSSSPVCYMFARVLRNQGAKGVPHLLKGLRSSSGHRQFILARELGRMGPVAAPAVPELLRIIKHSRGFPWGGERSAVLDALARIAPDDAHVLDVLKSIAGSDKDKWSRAAQLALREISGDDVDTGSAEDAALRAAKARLCVGTYKGQLRLGGKHFVVVTRLWVSATDPTKLVGDYDAHLGYSEFGELIQQGPFEGSTVVFEWSDSCGSGLLKATFSDAFTDFRGVYGDGLTWTGLRGW